MINFAEYCTQKNTVKSTLSIVELKKYTNKLLASPISQLEKCAICNLLEHFLLITNNYRGFNSLAWINWGYKQWKEDGEPNDRSRYLGEEYDREYY